MKKYLAELVGTFILIFCGTGAAIVNHQTNDQLGIVGVAFAFGLIVTALIFTFGNASGAHFNPSVTIAFAVANLFPKKEIIPYLFSQIIGAFMASTMLKLFFPTDEYLGATIPSGSAGQSFFLEIILTFILMLVVLFTSQGAKEKGTMAGIAIGAVVLVEAMFAGPISGASMNPVRSLAPAVVSGNIHSLWIYLTAPFLGATLATYVWKYVK